LAQTDLIPFSIDYDKKF